MSSSTANKVVAAFALGGVFLALWQGKNGAERYRRVWGVMLLSAVSAVLADFVPQLVGPFIALISLAYLTGHLGPITQTAAQIKTTAGVKTK